MQESYTLEKFNSGRTVVGDAITELAKSDDRIWLLTPDIGWGCGDFKVAHPDRFIDTGIAEQCVVGVSAGLALEGAVPFIIGMMPFMSMRDLEQVRTDLCYPNLRSGSLRTIQVLLEMAVPRIMRWKIWRYFLP